MGNNNFDSIQFYLDSTICGNHPFKPALNEVEGSIKTKDYGKPCQKDKVSGQGQKGNQTWKEKLQLLNERSEVWSATEPVGKLRSLIKRGRGHEHAGALNLDKINCTCQTNALIVKKISMSVCSIKWSKIIFTSVGKIYLSNCVIFLLIFYLKSVKPHQLIFNTSYKSTTCNNSFESKWNSSCEKCPDCDAWKHQLAVLTLCEQHWSYKLAFVVRL